jgi:hypothetical protein
MPGDIFSDVVNGDVIGNVGGFTLAWALWGVFFLIVEGLALWNRRIGDTLSEHIWRWLGIGQTVTQWIRVRRFITLAGLLWMILHFFTGGEF